MLIDANSDKIVKPIKDWMPRPHFNKRQIFGNGRSSEKIEHTLMDETTSQHRVSDRVKSTSLPMTSSSY
jgi:hypothetical protein